MDIIIADVEFNLKNINEKLYQLDSNLVTSVNYDNYSFKENPFISLDETKLKIAQLEIKLNKDIGQASREKNKLKFDQLKYDFQHMQALYSGILSKQSLKIHADKERELLLSTKFATNKSMKVHNRAMNGLQHEAINISNGFTQHDKYADDKNKPFLYNSHKQVDSLLDAGKCVMDNLRHQRGRLQLTRNRITDIVSSLGLSQSVMKLIQRRTAQDKVILYGGMIVTSILIFFIIFYLR